MYITPNLLQYYYYYNITPIELYTFWFKSHVSVCIFENPENIQKSTFELYHHVFNDIMNNAIAWDY